MDPAEITFFRMGKLSSALENADTSAVYPYGAMNFILELGIHFQVDNSHTRWHSNFKGLSQQGGVPIF
jgi:hypothetical protein